MTYRELFDQAIGEVPPSSIDVRRVVTRQRRLVKARRIGVYGTAAGAVLAVALGAGLVVDRPDRQPTAAASASASRPPYRKSNNHLPTEASAQYRGTVAAAFAARVPGVRWMQPTAGRGYLFPTGPTSDTPIAGDEEDFRNVGFSFAAYPVDPAGAFSNRLSVSALVEPQLGMFRYVMECGRQREDSCGLSEGPDGARVRESSSVEDFGRAGEALHYRRVDVLHRDGTWIVIRLESGDGRFLLSPEQLRELALDPALRPTW